ncbi:MAG: radical SAM protein [Thermoplasmata archaeon]|nr:radical SAM protein [Thermoplasmata archaeon]
MSKSEASNLPTLKPSESLQNLSNLTTPETPFETSKSVCPECLKIIDCEIFFRDNKVFMHKTCEEHGSFEVLIYSDVEAYLNSANYNKPGTKPLHYQSTVSKGCPDDCGLCEAHQQHSCVGIIEINGICNLSCPVCFADSKDNFSLPFERVKEMIDLYVKCEGQPEVLQISGGEPTLHPDIFRILDYAGKKGIKYPMLNTNGLKLSSRDFVKQLSETIQDDDSPVKKPIIYLQFDGLSDEIYIALRGKALLDIKMKALENCREFGMNVAIVPTIVKGINDHEIGEIIKLALNDNNIKSVNFQPSTLVGRYEIADKSNRRLTIPEILDAIENQTSGLLAKNGFINIPCPYPTCSVCNYVFKKEDKLISLTELLDVDNYMDYLVNRSIADVSVLPEALQALDSLLSMSAVMGSEKIENAICTSCGLAIPNISELADNITLISVHAFMDEYNFELKRAKKCCITEILPNGQMIPFCVYNILYRKDLIPEFKRFC